MLENKINERIKLGYKKRELPNILPQIDYLPFVSLGGNSYPTVRLLNKQVEEIGLQVSVKNNLQICLQTYKIT